MYHFISGLPRSGSTLLAALLRQNPKFRATMSTPVASLFNQMLIAMSRKFEGASMITAGARERLLRSVFDAYYDEPEAVVFDTNRMWTAKMPALTQLFPECRVICCVRDAGWILDSFEHLVHTNPFELSGIFGFNAGGNAGTRANALMAPDGLVGYALENLREAFFGENADRLIVVEYEALTKRPNDCLKMLYGLLEQPRFQHDFNNVQYDADEFDKNLGTPGLHRVRRKVEYIEREPIIPPGIFNQKVEFWRDPKANIRDVTVISF